MTGVEERVKGFVENWRLTHCAICQGPLRDGKFIMIDGKLYCIPCHELQLNEPNKPNEPNKLNKLNELNGYIKQP